MTDDLVERVIRIVRANSTAVQPDVVSEHVVLQLTTENDRATPPAVHEALATAVADDRLEKREGGYSLAKSR